MAHCFAFLQPLHGDNALSWLYLRGDVTSAGIISSLLIDLCMDRFISASDGRYGADNAFLDGSPVVSPICYFHEYGIAPTRIGCVPGHG